MPTALQIEPVNQRITVRLSGIVTPEELLELQATLRGEIDIDASWSALVDCSEMEDLQASAAIIQHISGGTLSQRVGRLAIVASRDAIYGLARIYQTHTDSESVRLFRSMEPAIAWLGAL
jgi:hypothetical protein